MEHANVVQEAEAAGFTRVADLVACGDDGSLIKAIRLLENGSDGDDDDVEMLIESIDGLIDCTVGLDVDGRL